MGPGRTETYKATIISSQGQFVHILSLHPFSTTHLTTTEALANGLGARMVILERMTSLMSSVINSCAPAITALKPTDLSPILLVIAPTAANSLNTASGSRSSRKDGLPNAFEVPLHHPQGKIPSPRFVLTSCVYRLMNVCNFFLGCSKVHYHVACLTLCRQHVKTDVRSTSQLTPLHEIEQTRRDCSEAVQGTPGRACHGPLERRTFC